MNTQKRTPGQELFERVEQAQGFAFIADGMDDWPTEAVLERARSAQFYAREAVRILSAFIRKYDRAARPSEETR